MKIIIKYMKHILKADIALDRFNISELAFESAIAELIDIWKIKR